MIDHYSFDLFPLPSERWEDLDPLLGNIARMLAAVDI